jgi:FKBP-type peptidyl-prolyl cis-trans isomerase
MSAYAAGDSLTSSISLSFNSTKKFQLEAYEHFYAYYTVPSSYSRTKNTLSVTVSNLSNFSISVMNSDGSSISTTRKKNILYFKNNAFIAENRYFIKIHNQRNIRSSGSINIRYTTDTTASPKTSHKDATNIASSHKRHQQKSTKSSSSRNASRQKSTNNSSSRNASRQKTANNSSSRNASRQKTTNNSSSRNASRQNSSSRNASRQKATKSSSSRKGKTAATNNASTSSKKYVSSGTTLSPVTPAIHYIRLKKGTSIALAERIYTTVPNHPISFTPSSSSLHITDGIVYATSAGLFYIIIQDGSYSSSCTVKVDP